MSNAIERLRELQVAERKSDLEAGEAAGMEWARDTATPKELRRLARHIEDIRGVENLFMGSPDAPYSHIDYLAFAIMRTHEDERSHDTASEFWLSVVSDDIKSERDEDFVEGFVNGSLAFWSDVEAQL